MSKTELCKCISGLGYVSKNVKNFNLMENSFLTTEMIC